MTPADKFLAQFTPEQLALAKQQHKAAFAKEQALSELLRSNSIVKQHYGKDYRYDLNGNMIGDEN